MFCWLFRKNAAVMNLPKPMLINHGSGESCELTAHHNNIERIYLRHFGQFPSNDSSNVNSLRSHIANDVSKHIVQNRDDLKMTMTVKWYIDIWWISRKRPRSASLSVVRTKKGSSTSKYTTNSHTNAYSPPRSHAHTRNCTVPSCDGCVRTSNESSYNRCHHPLGYIFVLRCAFHSFPNSYICIQRDTKNNTHEIHKIWAIYSDNDNLQ